MKLKQVAQKLGVKEQRIKTLKKDGIFKPDNQPEKNKTIDYTEQDINELRRIILLNRCGLSKNEILAIDQGKITIKTALENRRRELEDEKAKTEQPLRLLTPLELNCENLTDQFIETLYNSSKMDEEKGIRFKEPDDYIVTDCQYNPFVQSVECPYCRSQQRVDLEDYIFWQSSDEYRMGMDNFFEANSEPDSFTCGYCRKPFGVRGWFREYPLGAYDSSELETFMEEE